MLDRRRAPAVPHRADERGSVRREDGGGYGRN